MDASSLKLGVNVDHVATLRQARGTPYPDPCEAAECCRRAGAHNITVHLREDRRHIQERDVRAIRRTVPIPLNLEMAVHPDILAIALDVGPDEVCLVPERRRELTTEGGLDVVDRRGEIAGATQRLSGGGCRVSLFVDPDEAQVEAARDAGAPVVELHTGAYCEARTAGERERELERLIRAARAAHRLGLQVNAGHGINLSTIGGLLRVPHLQVLNIGHSIISRAVFVGLDEAVREMIRAMAGAGEEMP